MILAAWYHPILATLFALIAVFLMMVILLQRGRGVGLAGAFGGAATNTAFGSKTGDVLTWATVVIACIFLLVSVSLNYVFKPHAAGLGTGAPSLTAPAGQPPAAATVPVPAGTTTEAPGLGEALDQAAPPSEAAPPAEADDQPEPAADEPAPEPVDAPAETPADEPPADTP